MPWGSRSTSCALFGAKSKHWMLVLRLLFCKKKKQGKGKGLCVLIKQFWVCVFRGGKNFCMRDFHSSHKRRRKRSGVLGKIKFLPIW